MGLMEETQDTPLRPSTDAEAGALTETPEREQGAEAPEETPPEPPPEPGAEDKAKKDVQARINELTAKRREAERRAERLASELEEARRQKPPEPQRAEPQGKPKADQFETWEEFLDARDAWSRQEWQRELTQREQEREAKQAYEAEVSKWETRRQGFAAAEDAYRKGLGERVKEYDAYTDSMTPFLVNARGEYTNPDLARALFDAGPEVVHYLGQHLDKLEELSRADPYTIGREVGKIEKATKDRGREGRRFSTAPPPPPSVGGGGSSLPDPSRMSDAEYRVWRSSP